MTKGLENFLKIPVMKLYVYLVLGLYLAVPALIATPAGAQDPNATGIPNLLTGPLTGNGADVNNTPGYPLQPQQGTQGTYQGATPRGTDLNTSLENDQYRANASRFDQNRNPLFYQLPPDPPTEFQHMVANSTGKMLPLYGASLFRNVPSTFAPLDNVPVTPDYVIGPGDELLIQVWGQVTLNSRFLVDRAGNIYIPQVGSLHVAGISFGQLRDHLKTQMDRVFRNYDLNVNMGQLRSIQIFVVGQARRPGSYTVSSLSTLVNALFVSGGPSPQGSLRHIQLKRSGQVIVDFDLYDLLLHGEKAADAQLLPGDVIYIPPVGPQVAVAGSVNSPAIYELKSAKTATVDDVLKYAAGPSSTASEEKMRIERVDSHRMRGVLDLSLNAEGRSTTLQDGDILELIPIVDQYKNGVTLRGNVANPGHYLWHPGMRVGDLFPDKEALITREYWLKRGQLGQPALTYLPPCPPSRNRNLANEADGSNRRDVDIYNRVDRPANQDQYDSANQIQNQNQNQNQNQLDRDSYDCIQEPTTQQANPSDLRGTSSQYGQNSVNGRSDRSSIDSTAPPDQNQRALNSAAGTSAATALSGRNSGQFEPRNDVKLSAPDIDWSYAVIERQNKDTLTTSLFPFNLGGLVLEKDISQNLGLEPGDVVTIFSKADIRVPQSQQTKFVRLEGEFHSSGIYSVMPGETLQDLVKRAGGLTENAYLYGSEFTRESTRRAQQRRLNEYVDRVALQASTNSVNSASGAISALDSAAAAAAAAQSQNVVATLRQARATGRIVLQLKPDSDSVAQLPTITLEDGDRFIVPSVPATVSVTGAVYNPNVFVYDVHRRVGDYLQLAGGSNRDADSKSAYVIRADGSVISRRQRSSWHRDTFDNMHVYPGDTVVVPLNLHKGATLRTVVDIAQIVGQFGLAAAAASVVF